MSIQAVNKNIDPCVATIEYIALVMDGLSGGGAIPGLTINPFTGGYSFNFLPGPQTYDFRFDGGQNALTSTPRAPYVGVGTCTFTQNDAGSQVNAFYSAFNDPTARVTSFNDFNWDVVSSVSGDFYRVMNRGIIGFTTPAGGEPPHSWTLDFDFTTLAAGHLERGTFFALSDFDGMATGNETCIVTRVGGIAGEWLTYQDEWNIAMPHGEATYNSGLDQYEFIGIPATANGAIVYKTTQNLDRLIFDITNTSGGS